MIECKNVKVQFDKNIVLNNFNHIFKNNTITAIIGHSGAGKSTLLRSIAGLQQLNSGKILFNNEEIKKPNPNIFMMHQHYSNFPWKNCYENLMFPLQLHKLDDKKSKFEVYDLLEKVGLGNCFDKYPGELSGGMNQRLAFARTLIMKPNVLLMDEPMSALDENTRKVMQNLLIDMHKQTQNIIIFITHSNEEAKLLSDEIINLK